MTMVQALNLALRQEMQNDDSIIVLGEDVGVDGGVFRVTDGLIDKFGDERVLDTPLAESGIVGMSVGMAAYGLKPVCEIQFSAVFRTRTFTRLKTMPPVFAGGLRAGIMFPWSCAPRMAAASEPLNTIRKAGKLTGPTPPA
jgi:hypothetical protein